MVLFFAIKSQFKCIAHSLLEGPGARILVLQVDGLTLVGLVQKHHIFIEVNLAHPLHRVFYVQVVALLEQDRRVVNENAIQEWVETHLVLSDVGLDAVGQVVVDGILHVVGHELIFESILIDIVIFEDLNHDIKTSLAFIGVESNLEHSVGFLLIVFNLVKLVIYNKVEQLLNDGKR